MDIKIKQGIEKALLEEMFFRKTYSYGILDLVSMEKKVKDVTGYKPSIFIDGIAELNGQYSEKVIKRINELGHNKQFTTEDTQIIEEVLDSLVALTATVIQMHIFQSGTLRERIEDSRDSFYICSCFNYTAVEILSNVLHRILFDVNSGSIYVTQNKILFNENIIIDWDNLDEEKDTSLEDIAISIYHSIYIDMSVNIEQEMVRLPISEGNLKALKLKERDGVWM